MGTDNRNLAQESTRSLVERLRTALLAARGNAQIRERLREIVADSERFDEITRELGSRHALVRELVAFARHGDPRGERAA